MNRKCRRIGTCITSMKHICCTVTVVTWDEFTVYRIINVALPLGNRVTLALLSITGSPPDIGLALGTIGRRARSCFFTSLLDTWHISARRFEFLPYGHSIAISCFILLISLTTYNDRSASWCLIKNNRAHRADGHQIRNTHFILLCTSLPPSTFV